MEWTLPAEHGLGLAEAVLLDSAGDQSVAVVLVGGEEGAIDSAYPPAVRRLPFTLLSSQSSLDFTLYVQLGNDLDHLILLCPLPSDTDRYP